MILVAGATGNVGSRVVSVLQAVGQECRAFVRDAEQAQRVVPAAELSVGDFRDEASLARALEGVESALLSSADDPDKVTNETLFIQAAERAGVRRIVKVSTLGAEVGASVPFWDAHGRIEARLRGAALAGVILQSNFYMTNLLASLDQIRLEGRLVAPAGAGRIGMVDPADVAAVAAAALTTDRYDGRTLVLTGPRTITYADAAAVLSRALARPVEFVDVPEEAFRQGMLAAGLPGWLVIGLTRVFEAIRRGDVDRTTGDVAAVLGRPPRELAEFVAEQLAVAAA